MNVINVYFFIKVIRNRLYWMEKKGNRQTKCAFRLLFWINFQQSVSAAPLFFFFFSADRKTCGHSCFYDNGSTTRSHEMMASPFVQKKKQFWYYIVLTDNGKRTNLCINNSHWWALYGFCISAVGLYQIFAYMRKVVRKV